MQLNKVSLVSFIALFLIIILAFPAPAFAQKPKLNNDGSISPEKMDDKIYIELKQAYLNPAGSATNECAFVVDISFRETFIFEMYDRKIPDNVFFSLTISSETLNLSISPPYRKDVKISEKSKKFRFAGILKNAGPEKLTAEVSVYKKRPDGSPEEAACAVSAFELSPLNAPCAGDDFHELRRAYFNTVSNFILSNIDMNENSAANYLIVKYAFYISKLYNAKFETPQYFDNFTAALNRMRFGANFNYTFALFSGSMAVMESIQLESMKNISKNLEYIKEYCAGDKKALFVHDKVFYYNEKDQLFVDSAFWGGEKISEISVFGPDVLNVQSPSVKRYMEKLAEMAPDSSKACENNPANYSARGFKKKYPDALIVEETPGEKKCLILSFESAGDYKLKEHKDFIAAAKKSISSNAKPQYIKIAGLSAPAIKSHDYEKMTAELNRKTAEIEIFASSLLAPRDSSFLYFSGVGGALDFFDEMKKYAARIGAIFPTTQNFSDVKAGLERQLLIKVNPLLRPMYGFAVSDMTIILDDLYIAEGTAVAVVFNVLQKMPFDLSRDKNKKDILAEAPELKVSEGAEKYQDSEITFTVSGALEISSYSCYIGDRFVVANNMNFLKKIIRCHNEKKGSLGAESDFRYMRALYSDKKPFGFVYFGEAAIRKMVAPEFKISEMRRVNCLDCLDELESSLYLYRLVKNDPKVSPEITELINSGALYELPACPSGGHFELDAARSEFFCDIHGYRHTPKPLSDIPVKFITEYEEKEYRNFSARYNSYFTRFFDPVGVEISNDASKITFKTYILPLIENSSYNQLRSFAGGKAFASSFRDLICGDTVFLMNLKMRMFHGYKDDLSNIDDEQLRTDLLRDKRWIIKDLDWKYPMDVFSWVGPDFNLLINDFGFEIFSNNFSEPPVALVNNIKNKDTCLLYIFKSFRRYFNRYEDFNEGHDKNTGRKKNSITDIFSPFAHVNKALKDVRSAFRELEYLMTKASVYKDYVILKEPCFFFTLYFAVSNRYLIVSPNLDTVHGVIDTLADEKTAAKAKKELEPALSSHPAEHNAIALLNFSAASKIPAAAAEYFEKEQAEKCLPKLSAVNKAKFVKNIFPAFASASKIEEAAAPSCPSLTEYTIDPAGFFRCPIHAEAFMNGREGRTSYYSYDGVKREVTKEQKSAAEKTLRVLLGLLRSMSASLTFTPEGIYTVFTLQK